MTKTVTNDISMVLAKRANKIEAVDGDSDPPECIVLPYRGCAIASPSQSPDKSVEYIDKVRIEIESQLNRRECISRCAGHPAPIRADSAKCSTIVSALLQYPSSAHTQIIIIIIIIASIIHRRRPSTYGYRSRCFVKCH